MTLLRALLSALSGRDKIAGLVACGLLVALAWAAWRARRRRAEWRRDQAAVIEARREREAAKYTNDHAAAMLKHEMAREVEWASAARMDHANDAADALAAAVAKVAPQTKAITDAWLHGKGE